MSNELFSADVNLAIAESVGGIGIEYDDLGIGSVTLDFWLIQCQRLYLPSSLSLADLLHLLAAQLSNPPI